MRYASLLTVLLSFAVVVPSAQATVIFDNGSAASGDFEGFSDPEVPQIVADDFVLSASDTVRSIVVFGGYFSNDTLPASDNFSVTFYNDAGMPGTPVGSSALTVFSRVDTGLLAILGTRIFRYEVDLANPQTFTSGTAFWISVVNDTSGGVDPDDDWVWILSPIEAGGNLNFSVNGGASWTSTSQIARFQLDNAFAIPEPSTGLLLALGLVALAVGRRRRAQ